MASAAASSSWRRERDGVGVELTVAWRWERDGGISGVELASGA